MKFQEKDNAFKDLAKKIGADSQIAYFPNRSYPIYYGSSLVSNLGLILREFNLLGRILIVSNEKIKSLFGEIIESALKKENCLFTWALIPDGEKYKDLETVSSLYTKAAEAKIDKGSVIMALGGGVVQDISNYLAATYLRGVPFVQIPTTLLSQADIGIGGCAIDHPLGKSMVGQFYQPKFAVQDSIFLKTLPDMEIVNGLAEIINKVACLDGDKVGEILEDIKRMRNRDYSLLIDYIKLSNKSKIGIIEKDENGSQGTRLLLDWGHTITHALEKQLNYTIPHGIALGIGMNGAAMISAQLGYLSQERVELLRKFIVAAGLPTKLDPEIDLDLLMKSMALDQKIRVGRKRLVLMRTFGDCFVSDFIEDNVILNGLKSLR